MSSSHLVIRASEFDPKRIVFEDIKRRSSKGNTYYNARIMYNYPQPDGGVLIGPLNVSFPRIRAINGIRFQDSDVDGSQKACIMTMFDATRKDHLDVVGENGFFNLLYKEVVRFLFEKRKDKVEGSNLNTLKSIPSAEAMEAIVSNPLKTEEDEKTGERKLKPNFFQLFTKRFAPDGKGGLRPIRYGDPMWEGAKLYDSKPGDDGLPVPVEWSTLVQKGVDVDLDVHMQISNVYIGSKASIQMSIKSAIIRGLYSSHAGCDRTHEIIETYKQNQTEADLVHAKLMSLTSRTEEIPVAAAVASSPATATPGKTLDQVLSSE